MSFDNNTMNHLWELLDEMGEDIEEMFVQCATMMDPSTDISRQIKELYASYQQYQHTMDEISVTLQHEKMKLNAKKQLLMEKQNEKNSALRKDIQINHQQAPKRNPAIAK